MTLGIYSRSRDAAKAARDSGIFHYIIEPVMVDGVEKYKYVRREPDELDIPAEFRRTDEREPKPEEEKSGGVSLAPPLAIQKAIAKEFKEKVCTYPKCKCIVGTSTTNPEPVCPHGLERPPVETNQGPKVAAKQESAVSKTKAKTTKTKAAKVAKVKEPRGMVVDILKLSSRASGVSREELNKLTGWKGAPWKWLFKNPKKTGYCDRWGYTFKTFDGADGEVRYKTEKKAEATKAAA